VASRTGNPARRALAPFASASLSVRLHTRLRWSTAPFVELEALVPRTGAVLDVGCGHGLLALWLLEQAGGRRVTGVDPDRSKIAVAQRAAAEVGRSDRAEFVAVADEWLPDPDSHDTVVVADVLYLLGRGPALGLLGACARAVRPGGTVVIKEMADEPRWKRRLAAAQEVLAVRLVGLTRGATVDLVPEHDIIDTMTGAGLEVERVPMGRWLHPHVALVGVRPAR
jgi:2-polyprenyl-3-methyl-5-hydroxy-6-metoxy-1,4-benzoquinol methylase